MHPKRADFPCPMVMRPMEAFVSPIDGKVLHSRDDIRNHEREHGVIQVGDDPARARAKRNGEKDS